MYQDIYDCLAKLGLKRKEASVYLACLRQKQGLFVHEIVTASRLKRSTVDLILKRLLAQHIVSSFREGRRRKFVAEPPERILFQFQRGLDDFRALVPILMHFGAGEEQTRVTFHEGTKGVQSVYDDVIVTLNRLPAPERICYCVSSGRDVERINPHFRRQFIDRRVRNEIFVNMIAVRGTPSKTWPSSHRDRRITKMFDGKHYPFKIELNVYDDKIFIASFRRPIGGVVVRNRSIASSLRSLFLLLWDLVGPPEPYEDE